MSGAKEKAIAVVGRWSEPLFGKERSSDVSAKNAQKVFAYH